MLQRFNRAILWEKAPIHSAAALSIVFVALNDQFLLSRSATQSLWTPALLQFCASILPSPVIPSTFSDLNISVATPIYTSLVLIALELQIFKRYHAMSLFTHSLVLFSATFPLYIGAFFLSSSPFSIPWSLSYLVHAGLQAGIGVASIAAIKYTSAFAFCSLTLLSSALLLPVHGEILQVMPDQQTIQVFIAALGIYGAFAFWRAWASTDSPPNSPPAESESRWLQLPFGAHVSRYFFGWVFGPRTEKINAGKQGGISTLSDRVMPWPPLPPSTQWNGTRTFHAFDDVLLVVFFSHARYDVNLDAHREAYAPYFPNILYIGPASREDQGFNHSYDVFVDSYQSDEDFTGWYKMAGRMAHHMFYTAVKDNPCYSGYLWAPFDALLNIARLAQFPQERIWYHSPFGEYIPNPSLSKIKANEKATDKHPPPATVSTDTPRGYAEKFVPFGEDGWQWWWGEPHVGLEVCWPGYQKVRKEFRDRLQGLTGRADRFIGGSADTLYVPGALRDDLLETLGYFLETDCFLEIALPTTLHLILPRDQRIAFVDHWWIWTPPLNTTFVRQKWEEGLEVDSFHTFHWVKMVFGDRIYIVFKMCGTCRRTRLEGKTWIAASEPP
ncbi:hypothetical protein FRC01_003828 [Tulasnella sp. 417]|nr:hypothetical protein FRC01_003828 [Tulasnella sp. 417]